MNKYLEIMLAGFDEETDAEMIAKIESIADKDELAEICNIFVVLSELQNSKVSQAIWSEYAKYNK